MPVKCSRSSISAIEDVLFQNNARISSFLFIECVADRRRQLLSALAGWKKAKSKQSCLSSFIKLYKSSYGSKDDLNQILRVLNVIISILIFLASLLLQQGIESNPGPRNIRGGVELKSPSSFPVIFSFCTCIVLLLYRIYASVPDLSSSLLTFYLKLLLSLGIEPNPGPQTPDSRSKTTVISQNCRGLTDPANLIALLRKAYDNPNLGTILCLQETHCISRFALDNHFQGKFVIDNGERDQRGTAILIPAHLEISTSRISGTGRWSLAAVKDPSSSNGEQHIVIASIYAPNCHRESIGFFEGFFEALDEFCNDIAEASNWPHIVLAGDFNLVFNPNLDSLNRQCTQNESTLAVSVGRSLEEKDLIDSIIFDSLDSNRFTWKRGICCSRLDYIFISTGLSSRVDSFKTSWYKFGSRYDHAAVSIGIKEKSTIPRGRGYPKLFKNDINSPRSRTWLIGQLESAKLQIPNHWNPHQVHDFLKMTLRSKSLELRAMNKRTSSTEALTERINSAIQASTNESLLEADNLKAELLLAEEAEAEILRLKAGVKWREFGEKSTRYFLSRLKARSLVREIHSMVDSSGAVLLGLNNVLEHVKSFYSTLYSKATAFQGREPDSTAFFEFCPTLDPVQRQLLARPLTLEELISTLKSCQDSAPGLDGIPYSYYKSLGEIMLPSLLQSWNYALETGQLAQSHSQACITLLPKKDKDLKFIQNWRPISLSACDLKLITKSYANRLSLVLPHILSEAQGAYVPDRDISFNNRIIKSAQKYAQEHNKDYCLVSLDAKKAFDSVSHSYLKRVMEAYQFPAEFIKVFNTVYSNNYASVQVNGHLSSPFKLERGVKQGDALSCGLFVLAIDPLLRNIEANESIKGMIIETDDQNTVGIKVSAYADDVTILCKNRNLQPIFSEYEKLSKLAGLQLNADKTEVLNLINSNIVTSKVKYLGKEFDLGRSDSIRVCGLHFSRQPEVEYQLNVMGAITKMENIIASWKHRSLSLQGRMVAAKSFVISQIVFQAQVLQIASKEIKQIERLIYAFVNGAKKLYGPERIARDRLKAPKALGGINGIDVDCFIKSIQLKQYNKAMNKHRMLRELQLSFKGVEDDLAAVVRAHLRSHYKSTITSPLLDFEQITHVSSIPLKILLGPGTRGQQIAMGTNIATLFELQRGIVNGVIARTQANIVIKQLPTAIRSFIRNNTIVDSNPRLIINSALDEFSLINNMPSSKISLRFRELKKPDQLVLAKEIYKQPTWQEPEGWQGRLWQIKNPQLRRYRLKLFYKDIFSNERRYRFNLADSPSCTICGQVESISHQLFECNNAQSLWRMYSRLTGGTVNSLLDIITSTESVEREIIKSVIIKRLIQIDRSAGLSLQRLKNEIIYYYRIESQVSSNTSINWLGRI